MRGTERAGTNAWGTGAEGAGGDTGGGVSSPPWTSSRKQKHRHFWCFGREICSLDAFLATPRIKKVLDGKLPVGLLMFHPTGFN